MTFQLIKSEPFSLSVFQFQLTVTDSNFRPKPDIYVKVTKLIARGTKYEKSTPSKVEEKLKNFKKVFDIEQINANVSPVSCPLSPKRCESPVVLEDCGRGKR